MIGRTLKNVGPKSMKFIFPTGRMGMATTIDPRSISPDPPKSGRPKVKGWERATFTIKVFIPEGNTNKEWSCLSWRLFWRKS